MPITQREQPRIEWQPDGKDDDAAEENQQQRDESELFTPITS